MASYTPEEIEAINTRAADEMQKFGYVTAETKQAMISMGAGVKGLTETMAKGFKGLGSAAMNLTKSIAEGNVTTTVFNDSISATSSALGDLVGMIPYVGGALKAFVKGTGDYTQAVNKQATVLFSSYEQLSKVGATGAEGISSVFANLQKLKFGTEELDQFTSLIGENSKTLATFGKTVGDGVNEFSNVASAVHQLSGTEFREMGISIGEINKGIMSYTKMQVLTGGRQKMSTDQLILASQDYIKEVDKLSKITGADRAKQEAMQESAMAEERYAGFRLEMEQKAKMGDEDAKARLKTADTLQKIVGAAGGDEMRKGILNAFSGFNSPETAKLQQQLPKTMALIQNGSSDLELIHKTMVEENGEALDITKKSNISLAKVAGDLGIFYKLNETARVQAAMNKGTLEEQTAAAEKNQTVTDAGTKLTVEAQEKLRATRDNMQTLINAGIVPVTKSMTYAATATDAAADAMVKMAKTFGVDVKTRKEAGKAAGAAATPAAAAPVGKGWTGSTPAAAPGKPAISGALKDDLLQRLSSSGITDKKSHANILAQFEAESGGRTDRKENLNYTADQLLKSFPKKFKDAADAQSTASQGPEAVGNRLYGGRMGNTADEGFKYRGRGLVQLTGKENYEKFGKMLGIDLLKDPDLAASPEIAKQIAVAYFKDKQQSGTDLTNIASVGKAVGYAGGEEETQKRAQMATAYMANGGIVRAAPGGVDIVAAEAGKNEAFVPLPDGRTIPVQIAGSNDQLGIMSAQLSRLDDIVRVMQTQLGVSQKLLQYAQ
jgi:putative chitinase